MYYELENVKRDVYRMNLDNGRSFEFHTAVLDSLDLWTKNTIDKDLLDKALTGEECYTLKKTACRFLEKRAYSYKELFDKLYKYEPDCNIRHTVLEELKEVNLINDEEYAQKCAFHYMNIKRCSIREAKNKMVYTKGLKKTVVDNVLEDYDVQERENLNYLIEHKFARRIDDFNDFKQVQKVKASLYRLGFFSDDINEALDDYKENEEK